MQMSTISTAPVKAAASVSIDRIGYDDAFCFRAGGIDLAHKADLASTIRNTERALDPVILWQPEGQTEGGRTKPLRGIGAYGWRSSPNSALRFV